MPTIEAAEGLVQIEELSGGLFQVTLKPFNPGLSIPRRTCQTTLSEDVIKAFLSRSYPWLCESLARHDDPEYIAKTLRQQIFAYFTPQDFNGKRILDFGCGTGASTMFLASLFPDAEVVGVELSEDSVAIARKVLAERNLPNARFFLSPDPNSLPPEIGTFDYVVLSAVYEHLLPGERRQVMPMIWSKMNRGGSLLISQTPHRYFPYEHHTTGLWWINYLPDKLALWVANRWSKLEPEAAKSKDWNTHLRRGIRGGTEPEILADLRRAHDGTPRIRQPREYDRAAYWLSCTEKSRFRLVKVLLAAVFRVTDRLWGMIPSINIDVVIRKPEFPTS